MYFHSGNLVVAVFSILNINPKKCPKYQLVQDVVEKIPNSKYTPNYTVNNVFNSVIMRVQLFRDVAQ